MASSLTSALSRLTTREIADKFYTTASALVPGSARIALYLTEIAAGRGVAARAATALLTPAHRHFCVDEDPEKASRVMLRLDELGLGGILDYAAEAAPTEAVAAKNTAGVVRSATVSIPNRTAIVCKISALAPAGLLEQHSAHLWAQRSIWHDTHGESLLSAQSVPPNAGHLSDLLACNEAEMLQSVGRVEARLHEVCAAAEASGLQVMVDAEEWAVQPSIDHIVQHAMAKFNTRSPIVHTTVQAYLADARARTDLLLENAQRLGYKPAVKIVRGAYMDLEARRSRDFDLPSPVCSSIEHTAAMYDDCVSVLIERAVDQMQGSVLIATHNASAVRSIIEDHGLEGRPESHATRGCGPFPAPRIRFAQLKGMSDALSLELAEQGFGTDKYVPYGSIDTTLKYLARRALENSDAASGASHAEMRELVQELTRRLLPRHTHAAPSSRSRGFPRPDAA